jgi:hypothetical protein
VSGNFPVTIGMPGYTVPQPDVVKQEGQPDEGHQTPTAPRGKIPLALLMVIYIVFGYVGVRLVMED